MTVDNPRVQLILIAMNRKHPQSSGEWLACFKKDGDMILQAGDNTGLADMIIEVPQRVLELPTASDSVTWIEVNLL